MTHSWAVEGGWSGGPEFGASVSAHTPTLHRMVSDAECEILFRVFDRDKSGSMDVEEVCYMFQVDYRSKDGGDGAKRLLDARLRLISRYVFTSFLRRCAVTCK